MFRVSLHEEGRVKAGRSCWIIKCVLLWFNPCPSSRIFFGDSTTGDEDGSQGVRNTF